jgi:hypothetical protein
MAKQCGNQCFYFLANFRNLAKKKEGAGESNKGIFEIFFLNRHILTKKT